jgi:hypothetical protein
LAGAAPAVRKLEVLKREVASYYPAADKRGVKTPLYLLLGPSLIPSIRLIYGQKESRRADSNS